MNKPHKARKEKDVHRLRAILLNINDEFQTYSEDYNCEENHFLALLNALEAAGVVSKWSREGRLSTSQYCIADIDKFERWKRSEFYTALDKYVIPFVQLGTEILKHIPTL